MKKFEDILILSDLDGTFLSKQSKEVPRNIEKIRYFTEQGGHFSFATGRGYPHFLYAAPNSPSYANCPVVSANGMALYDLASEKMVDASFTDSAIISKVVDLVYEKNPNVLFRGMGQGGIITFQPENSFMKREMERGDCPVFVIERDKWINEKFYKMTLRADHETLVEMSKLIEESFGDSLNLCFSWPTIFEIQTKGMSKAVTALRLRDMLSVGGVKKKLYAVGDYENDIEMLKAADVAVCPSNAIDEVKDICDLCLCDNDSGVIADLIEYIENNL